MEVVMKITATELAKAVGKPESYVRQHIYRGHLDHVKEGRNVFVTTESATLWAKDRGLKLNLPVQVFSSVDTVPIRTARTAVLAWHPANGDAINLFTHVRHRREDALGPWASTVASTWDTERLPIDLDGFEGEFQLHVIDEPFDECESRIASIVDEGVLRVRHQTVTYALENSPNRHWAYRDLRGQQGRGITSPFSQHSAEIVEYWSFSKDVSDIWENVTENHQSQIGPLLKKLRFELARLSDRSGNLVISSAFDSVECDLSAHRTGALTLSVQDLEMTPNKYTADIWAYRGDDVVLRRIIPVDDVETEIECHSDIDRIGFALSRNADGQCIDSMDVYLMSEINIAMHFSAGPTVDVRDRSNAKIATLSPFDHRSSLKIDADKNDLGIGPQIRGATLSRRAKERERTAKEQRDLARFGPGKFDDAVEYFIGILYSNTFSEDPIYLADRYFMSSWNVADQRALYLRVFNATKGRELRVLSTQQPTKTWWTGPFRLFANDVSIRTCLTSDGNPAFHDRFLVTNEKEILITNSFSGWRSGGVTFASAPFQVYRSEAERLWQAGTPVVLN